MSDPFSAPPLQRPAQPMRAAPRAAQPDPQPAPRAAPAHPAAQAQAAQPVAQPVAQAQTRAPAAPAAAAPAATKDQQVPTDFPYDTEHPVLNVPFSAIFGDSKLEGTGLSLAAAYVKISGPFDPRWTNHRAPVALKFDFENFSVQVNANVIVAGSRGPGEMTLQFADPLGPHLPQLRHILNSYIAGDLVTLGSFLAYTGPTKPKAAKADESTPLSLRIRGYATAAASALAILAAVGLMYQRATSSTEIRPVFVERDGRPMRATTAGQISYLNPQAKKGEVVFSINSNTGDVLNFQLPCDCEVSVTDGMFEGATVLPVDVILSIFNEKVGVRVNTQISIEGLTKVMDGAAAYLDLDDGRTIPVQVVSTSATTVAADQGELFVPVDIVPPEGVLTTEDIGKTARLRLSSSWLNLLNTNTNTEGEAS